MPKNAYLPIETNIPFQTFAGTININEEWRINFRAQGGSTQQYNHIPFRREIWLKSKSDRQLDWNQQPRLLSRLCFHLFYISIAISSHWQRNMVTDEQRVDLYKY